MSPFSLAAFSILICPQRSVTLQGCALLCVRFLTLCWGWGVSFQLVTLVLGNFPNLFHGCLVPSFSLFFFFFFTETPIQPLDLMDLLSLSLIFYLIAFCSASWEVSSALHSKFSIVYTISAVIFLTSEDASPPGTARFLQLLFFFYVLISVFSVHAFLKGLMSPSCLLIFKRGIPWKPFPWGSLWGDLALPYFGAGQIPKEESSCLLPGGYGCPRVGARRRRKLLISRFSV